MKFYEWTCEEIDREGEEDIIDSDFSEFLSSFKSLINDYSYDIGLTLTEGNEDDGVTNTEWAYIKDGKLPDFFTNSLGHPTANKVPQRFHKELAKCLNHNNKQ